MNSPQVTDLETLKQDKKLFNMDSRIVKPELQVNLTWMLKKRKANLLNQQSLMKNIENETNELDKIGKSSSNRDPLMIPNDELKCIPAKKFKLLEQSKEKANDEPLVKLENQKDIGSIKRSIPAPSILRKTKSLTSKVAVNANSSHSTPKIDADFQNSTSVSLSVQTDKCPLLSIEYIKDNDKAIDFYTGLQNYSRLFHIFQSLGSDAYNLMYYCPDEPVPLSHIDQFFMTLVLLRQQKTHCEISILFGITLKDIKNIFITWIKFMSLEWQNIELPKRVKTSLSKSLKNLKNLSINGNKIDTEPIDLVENEENSVGYGIKKKFKILSGPKNYIELHLMKDITVICHVLVYLKSISQQKCQ